MARSKLTAKQLKFVQEYLVDLNATQAAIRAGYSKKTAEIIGYENLRKPGLSAILKEEMDKRAKKTEITAEYVLNTIRETIERCAQKEPVMEWDAEAKCMVETGEWQFKENGVLKGCELLGKHLGLYLDRVDHSGKIGVQSLLSIEEKEKIAQDKNAIQKLRDANDAVLVVTKGK